MNNIVDRDIAALEKFIDKLSHFCDNMDDKASKMIQHCRQAEHAMQDASGTALSQRLTDMATDLKDQVAFARALAGRLSRSTALLVESETEE